MPAAGHQSLVQPLHLHAEGSGSCAGGMKLQVGQLLTLPVDNVRLVASEFFLVCQQLETKPSPTFIPYGGQRQTGS